MKTFFTVLKALSILAVIIFVFDLFIGWEFFLLGVAIFVVSMAIIYWISPKTFYEILGNK